MSCRTAYLMREDDGSHWFAVDKRGPWRLTQPAGRDAVLRFIRAQGVPLDRVSDGGLGDVYCQGVLLDLPGRRYRCYPCYGDHLRLDEVEAAISASAMWSGWDAGVAMGGREEFAEVLPSAVRVIRPYRVLDEQPPEPEPMPQEDWFADWDRDTLTLTVRDDEASADWTMDEFLVLTTVDRDRVALDYRLTPVDTHPVHPLLAWLRRGPDALLALSATPPYPSTDREDLVRSSVTVNRADRVIGYSLTDLVPARLLGAVLLAWPGWRVEPMPDDGGGHRQLSRPSIRVLPGPPFR
ncbi:MAG TPA: hypothetical protein VFI65_09410 [Streptosporangiaceae bacterium]|nr:hypothetical protein [Streptosporangiaceae bacterium]